MNTFDLIHNEIVKNAGDLQDKSILDYGCGKGGLIKQLNNYFKILAVDNNEEALRLAKGKFTDLINSRKLTLKHVKSPKDLTETFDAIFCHNVLECFDDKVDFVNDLYKLLNPSGKLVLSNLDFDSAIYNHSNTQLTRELLHLFNDTKQDWMQYHDGQIGRKSRGIFYKSLFKNFKLKPILISETEYTEENYGYNMSKWIVDIAATTYGPEMLNAWLSILDNLYRENDYYFSINLMIIIAEK
jgi:cyclopropane fatty-acyl-phospholipid synthase-like methyltransferase